MIETFWTEAVGWTLIHFCWQAAAIAALYGLLTGVMDLRSDGDPSSHYLAGCTALCLMLAAPLATFSWLARGSSIDFHVVSSPAAAAPAFAGEQIFSPAAVETDPLNWTAWLVFVWLAGVGLYSLRLSAEAWRWHRMRRQTGPDLSDHQSQILQSMASKLGIRRRFGTRFSAAVASPVVTGFFRYTLLLPVSFFSQLSVAEAEAILVHELAHIRRRDGAVNFLQVVLETLFFFHPAVWWVSKNVRIDREKCCDAIAAETIGNSRILARALLALEETRPPSGRWALAARRGSLEDRMRSLLTKPAPKASAGRLGIAASLLGLLAMAGSVWASSIMFNDAPPEPPPAPAAPSTPAAPAPAVREEGPAPELPPALEELAAPPVGAPPAPAPVRAPRPPRSTEPSVAQAPEAPTVPAIAAPEVTAVAPPATPAPPRTLPSRPTPSARRPAPVSPAPAPMPAKPVAPPNPAPNVQPAPAPLAAPASDDAAPVVWILAQTASPDTDREKRLAELRTEISVPYSRWLQEDVLYIIEAPERAAFLALRSDDERSEFVRQFWQRRDPTPQDARNEFKEEHYRRIAYANERFGTGQLSGWRTDLGRTYIVYGPPDQIEDHPSENYQHWFYKEIPGVGKNVSFEFGGQRLIAPRR